MPRLNPWRTALLLLLLLLLRGALLVAADADEVLLRELSRTVNLRSADAQPFILEADVTLQMRVPQRGHYTWKWAGRNLWSQEVSLGSFHQLLVQKGDTLYTSRNSDFTPLRVSQVQDLLNVFSNQGKSWEIKKSKEEVEDGAARRCFELRRSQRGSWNPERLVCFDPATMDVVSDDMKYDQEYRRKEFSGYQEFGEHRYPTRLTLFVNGSPVVKVENVTLRQENLSEEAFSPEPGSIARRRCEGMQWPAGLKTPDPVYPKSAAQNRMGGTAVLAITVLPDGSVTNINVLQSAGRTMDEAAQQAVGKWKFKPAMCGSEAITADIQIEVNFTMH
jgi:TonB family protein